ncbi:MAG: HepT-like ribonuclease domain-containing protein [Armatimonadota bacterium]
MQPRDRASLLDIVESIHIIQGYMAGVTRESFLRDVLRQDAVIRRFEIIGEAATRLSQEFRDAHPEVPWNRIRTMRNFLSHVYDKVNIEIVLATTEDDLAPLLEGVEGILAEG